MLTVTPAFILKPTKDGDEEVPNHGKWEARYGDGSQKWSEWSAVHRACPLLAAAECLSNALFWMAHSPPEMTQRQDRQAAKTRRTRTRKSSGDPERAA